MHEGLDTRNFFGVIFTGVIILFVIVAFAFTSCIYLGVTGVNHIKNNGMSNTVSRVWNGPTNTPAR